MTAGYGLGMLAMGMTAILIGALIIYKVINTMEENRLTQEKKEREKIDGLD